ncbi:MAG: hypothetical protein R2911_28925 [Caldilineaceae bacterium]
MSQFSTSNEKALHAELKSWYADAGDQFEQKVGRYFIDIVQPHQLVEIQTRNLGALRSKLTQLAKKHTVRLVHPIAQEKWIVKLPTDAGDHESRRKSPKRGGLVDLFGELVAFPTMLHTENLSLEVLLIREEEVRRHEPNRAWRRRGWVTHERRLLEVVERRVFHTPADLATLLPSELNAEFTSADLARALGKPRRLAQQMIYCLREAGQLAEIGKKGRAKLYACAS